MALPCFLHHDCVRYRGTKPVILGSDYFDYSLAALAIGLQK